MGRKINPTTYRLGINKGWASRWIPSNKKFGSWLKEDEAVRNVIMAKVKDARMVKENTILLNLQDSKTFVKNSDGTYDLKK